MLNTNTVIIFRFVSIQDIVLNNLTCNTAAIDNLSAEPTAARSETLETQARNDELSRENEGFRRLQLFLLALLLFLVLAVLVFVIGPQPQLLLSSVL